jgi:predicted nuclease of predicted toxin-antitoxin system
MRVLLDNNLDRRLARLLVGHEVTHARRLGWAELQNGDLIASGEAAGFDVLITGDKNLRYQQNLKDRRISIVTLNTRFIILQDIAPLAPKVLTALEELPEGSFITIGED